jgi:hypothetical protein
MKAGALPLHHLGKKVMKIIPFITFVKRISEKSNLIYHLNDGDEASG